EALGQGVVIRQRAMATVKCRVEAGDLRQLRAALKKCQDRREVVWLMKRRERGVARELRGNLRGYPHGAIEVRAAMDNTMADGEEVELLRAAQPVARDLNGRRQIANFVGIVSLVDQGLLVRTFGFQARSRADAIDLTFDETMKLAARTTGRKDLEF